jgi:hypothetical protein
MTMNSENYFPEQRHLLQMTVIRRDRVLPLDLIGDVEVSRNTRVDLRTPIARGTLPAEYIVLDALKPLRIRSHAKLDDLLHVRVGQHVDLGELLAGKERGKRNLRSPISGTVAYIGEGRIILQAYSEPKVVEAGLTGVVVETRRGRGAVIEAAGAVVQGVWGNDQWGIGPLRIEPEEGLEHIFDDTFGSDYSGAVIVTKRPLTRTSLQVIHDQQFGGVIAPSIAPALHDELLSLKRAVLLTEGFGAQRMSGILLSFLSNFEGKNTTLDTFRAGVLEARRPEAVISVAPEAGQKPSAPRNDLILTEDTQVRLTRGKFASSLGQIISLPKNPIVLDNGLRVPCAEVRLFTGELLHVPLENLEVFG